MFAFFVWVVIASYSHVETFREFLNRLVFYVVIVHTLTTWVRLQKFLGWWTAMITITAFLAIAGEYFWDPLGSYDLTHGRMKDRLVLNLSMVNNPNALGHSLIPVIPMLYYFCIWKRPVFMKQIGYIALLLPLFAIYLTQSKGAYLAGAATILATLTFGRPKTIQVIIGVIFFLAASSTLYILPRMTELDKVRTDEAVQGRIRSFTTGHYFFESLTRGVGQGEFVKAQFRHNGFYKAPHSSYVQMGAELGKTGMFLFLLIMWCNFRTLMFARTRTDEEERVRRLLFVLALTYMISGWMVDFAYRATFFMFTAAIAAFHRNLYGLAKEATYQEGERPESMTAVWQQKLLPQTAPAGVPNALAMSMVPESVSTAPAISDRQTKAPIKPWLARTSQSLEETGSDHGNPPPKFWNKIGLADIGVTLVLLKATDIVWVTIISRMSE